MEGELQNERPKLVTGVLVFKDGKCLLGRRSGGKPGSGQFGTPGGHLESLERLQDAVLREIKEEVDIEVENLRFLCVTTVHEFAPAHFVVIFFRADWKSGEPRNCEPDRCEGWNWYALNQLPEPLTPGTRRAVQALQSGELLVE